ncbi:MAG: helix-turn-helix domain-containing protein [Pseudomonadota bacterium]
MPDANDVIAFSVPEVSRKTGAGQTTIWKNIREGRLPARKLGARTLVLREDLERFLKELPPITGVAA